MKSVYDDAIIGYDKNDNLVIVIGCPILKILYGYGFR